MSAEGIMENMSERCGWSTEEQLDLALDFINNQCDDDSFQDFLEVAAMDQDFLEQTDVCSWCHEPVGSADRKQVAGFTMHAKCAAAARARELK